MTTIATTPGSSAVNGAAPAYRGVRWWLYALSALIFALVVVGGATRLTDSGLSITEWQPILGIIPPLNQADWLEAFAKYREIPEYQQVNKGMSLAEFKFIYWWEWAHRFLGRVVGFAFLVPLLFFWVRGALPKGLWPRLLAIFVLGGLQGAMGWYMVMSGLVDRVDVSQYRLAAHMTLAMVIFAAIWWTALTLGQPSERVTGASQASNGLRLSAAGLCVLVVVQTAAGAFVAGLQAGYAYNDWPLMDGQWVPDGMAYFTPLWRNLFENEITVQFVHRILAYVLVVWSILHVVAARRATSRSAARTAVLLAAAVLAQAALGVWTLVALVPISLALLHQAGAVVVLAIALTHLHALGSVEYHRAGCAAGKIRQTQE